MHRIASIIVNALAGGVAGRLIFIGIAASSGCKCGGNTAASTEAGADVDVATFHVCYEPSDPLLAYSCDAVTSHCDACPASCDVDGYEAGAGVCK
jgi:hypothetical protein